jgi:hypothetical protein
MHFAEHATPLCPLFLKHNNPTMSAVTIRMNPTSSVVLDQLTPPCPLFLKHDNPTMSAVSDGGHLTSSKQELIN